VATVYDKATVRDERAAVPNAVLELGEHLRWTTLTFDAAEAMLAGLEASP